MKNDAPLTGLDQIPLIELLRQVPIGQRLVIEESPTSTHFIPVARYCHEAADKIEQLEQDLNAMTIERNAYRSSRNQFRVDWDTVYAVMKNLRDEKKAARAAPARYPRGIRRRPGGNRRRKYETESNLGH